MTPDIVIEEQVGAAPGFEWFYSVPAPRSPGSLQANCCGTATTQAEALVEVGKLCAKFGYGPPECPRLSHGQ